MKLKNIYIDKIIYKKKISAFSLIELSIVLIIIGLLVAGITGGASLIQSAKIRSAINELRNMKQAFNIFYANKERLPGDLDGNGLIGYKVEGGPDDIEKPYTASTFKKPYDGTDSEYGIPNQITSPFVELYLDGILDFKPKNVSQTDLNVLKQTGGVPSLKSFPDYFMIGLYRVKFGSNKDWRHNIKSGNYIEIVAYDLGKKLSPKIFKDLDIKIDDGNYNTGYFISDCDPNKIYSSYEEFIAAKTTCRAADYKVDIE